MFPLVINICCHTKRTGIPGTVMTVLQIIPISDYTPKNSRSLVIITLLKSHKDHGKHGGILMIFFLSCYQEGCGLP